MTDADIAVVGAGIGGLATALMLARRKRTVTLIERREDFGETGAGLQLSPNASRILLNLGLGSALEQAVGEPEHIVVRSLRTGRETGRIALGAFMRERFCAPYWVIRRSDLQTILLDAIRAEPSIRLLSGLIVETVEESPNGPILAVTDANGIRDRIEARAVIGADGLWSQVRRCIGETAPPAFQGFITWRTTLSRDRLPEDFIRNETGLWLGRKGHVVHYPIAGGRLLNIVAIQPATNPIDGWSAPGRGQDLLAHHAGASTRLRDLFSRAEDWRLWSLFDRPAETLARGRIALVGDAAHPILPFLAQGAALAIEDGAYVSALLDETNSVEEAFSSYQRQRLDRVRRVQAEARRNGKLYHRSGLIGLGRDQIMRRIGPRGMTERYAWLYGHRSPSIPSQASIADL